MNITNFNIHFDYNNFYFSSQYTFKTFSVYSFDDYQFINNHVKLYFYKKGRSLSVKCSHKIFKY